MFPSKQHNLIFFYFQGYAEWIKVDQENPLLFWEQKSYLFNFFKSK